MIKKIKEQTLEEYLGKLSSTELDEMYEEIKEIIPNCKKRASKEEKIDAIIEKTLASFLIAGIGFTDKEQKQLNDIMNGKKIDNIGDF